MSGGPLRGSVLRLLVRLNLTLAWRPPKTGGLPETVGSILLSLGMTGVAFGLGFGAFVLALGPFSSAGRLPLLLLGGSGLLALGFAFVGMMGESMGGGLDPGLLFHLPVSAREVAAADTLGRLMGPMALPPLGFFAGFAAGSLGAGHPWMALAALPALVLWELQMFHLMTAVDYLLYTLRRSRRATEWVGTAFLVLLLTVSAVQVYVSVASPTVDSGGWTVFWGFVVEHRVALLLLLRVLPGFSAGGWLAGGWEAPLVLLWAAVQVALLAWAAGGLLRRLSEGAASAGPRRKGAAGAVRPAVARPVFGRIPGALFLQKEFRSFGRDPHLKSMLMGLLVGPTILFAVISAQSGAGFGIFLHYGAPYLLLLYLATLAYNHLGLERAGLADLLVSPYPRWRVLLGKNLSLMALYLLLIVLNGCFLLARGAGPRELAADLSLALPLGFVYAGAGNFLAIFLPVPVAPKGRRLRPQIPASRVFLVAVLQSSMLGVVTGLSSPLMLGRLLMGRTTPGWAALWAGVMVAYGALVYAALLAGAARVFPVREPEIFGEVCRSQG